MCHCCALTMEADHHLEAGAHQPEAQGRHGRASSSVPSKLWIVSPALRRLLLGAPGYGQGSGLRPRARAGGFGLGLLLGAPE